MGYDVHITRKKFWFDEINEDIAQEEWIELVIEDSEMRLDKFAETSLSNGQILRVESEGLAVWTSYSKHAENESMAWFDYFNGRIAVKNPIVKYWGKCGLQRRNWRQKSKVMKVKFMMLMEMSLSKNSI